HAGPTSDIPERTGVEPVARGLLQLGQVGGPLRTLPAHSAQIDLTLVIAERTGHIRQSRPGQARDAMVRRTRIAASGWACAQYDDDAGLARGDAGRSARPPANPGTRAGCPRSHGREGPR